MTSHERRFASYLSGCQAGSLFAATGDEPSEPHWDDNNWQAGFEDGLTRRLVRWARGEDGGLAA